MPDEIGAHRLRTLLDRPSPEPAAGPRYRRLAESLSRLIADGHLHTGAKLPSERLLAAELGLSRTTLTRAYALLVERGYAQTRTGAGTFTRLPGGRRAIADRALSPGVPGRPELLDLNCAAPEAPPGIGQAYARAVESLPHYLGGNGYYPAGLPDLQEALADSYTARGLPTAPEQIMVTSGALSAAALVAYAFTRPGTRVLVEEPTYPNATTALRARGARLIAAPVDPGGWPLADHLALVRRARPALAYLVPDFHNPTGLVMDDAAREAYGQAMERAGTIAVIDESHQALSLDGQEMPAPLAAYAPGAITLGSAAKTWWGGLRVGWIRAEAAPMERLTRARLALDLGTPPLEQLVLWHLLGEDHGALADHRTRLAAQRETLLGALTRELPDWSFHRPAGGLSVWCELPRPYASAVARAAEDEGVALAPGPVFAIDGGLERFVRIPWTQSPAALTDAVAALARARARTDDDPGASTVSGTVDAPRITVG